MGDISRKELGIRQKAGKRLVGRDERKKLNQGVAGWQSTLGVYVLEGPEKDDIVLVHWGPPGAAEI